MGYYENYLNQCFLAHYERKVIINVYKTCYKEYIAKKEKAGEYALILLRLSLHRQNLKLSSIATQLEKLTVYPDENI